jgi:hypothetical protein
MLGFSILAMFGLFRSKSPSDLRGAAILVASLTEVFAVEMEADADVYRRHYRKVRAQVFPDAVALVEAVQGIDLLHLFGKVDLHGQLSTELGGRLTSSALLDACVSSNVKVVIIASENDANSYVRGVPARPLNLVMTLDRKGKNFSEFLDKICGLLVTGSTLPAAWTKIALQFAGPLQDNLPACIFHAGKPEAVLLR